MTAELETGLPSIRRIQNFIRETQEVEIKLLTGDLLSGKVFWQDSYCISLKDQYDQETMIWRQAIAYLKPRA